MWSDLVGAGLVMAVALAGCGGRSSGAGGADAGQTDSAVLAVTDSGAEDLGDAGCTNGAHACPVGCVGALQCFEADATCPPLPPCAPAPLPDAACTPVLASDYDQSCAVDSDCRIVSEVTTCPIVTFCNCTFAAINKREASQYNTAYAQVSAGRDNGCSCPCIGLPICRSGRCEAGSCGPETTPDAALMCAAGQARCQIGCCQTTMFYCLDLDAGRCPPPPPCAPC